MLIKKTSIKKTPKFLLNLLQLFLLIAFTLNIREEELIDLLTNPIQRLPHPFQPLPFQLFMGGLILDQYLILLVLMRGGVLAVDELDNRMIFVRGGPIRKIFLTLEAEGLIEPLFDVRVDVMERFMLEVSLTFFDVLVGGDLICVLCPVFYFLLLF